MAHPGGRPTEYQGQKTIDRVTDFYRDAEPYYESPVEKQDKNGNVTTYMERKANTPMMRTQLAQYLNISRVTLYTWMDLYPEFLNAIKKGEERLMQEFLVENGLLGNYNPAFAIFTAKNKLGWTDKTTTESTVKVEMPQKITIEIVRPNDAPANT
jgi:hypothetical protein